MATLAATGDTWGISGATFLVAYGVIAVGVWIAATIARRSLTEPTAKRPVGDVTARPHDVAYLNEGAELALFSALSTLRLRGLIVSTRGSIQAVGRIDVHADELERAIHFSTATPVHRKRLPSHRPVASALSTIERRLVDAGLLLSVERRGQIRRIGAWMLAVAGLGLVRLLAGIADAKPVGFLVVAVLVAAAAGVVQLLRAPRRSRLGDRTLAGLRTTHHGLAPALRPDWTVYGPAGAALGIGIFGTTALWASDPALAAELETQRAAVSSSGDGGSFFSYDGGSSGGDGGGGGDSGGGGGCGGGGGGCGG